jgi:hypothetical protein
VLASTALARADETESLIRVAFSAAGVDPQPARDDSRLTSQTWYEVLGDQPASALWAAKQARPAPAGEI